jgi:hypothetical protein
MPANSTFYLVRHAEKPTRGMGLSPAGQARADAYVAYFQNQAAPAGGLIRWDYLFACKDSTNSERPRLTITPLGEALNNLPTTQFADAQYKSQAEHFQQNAKLYEGKNVLICWHHGKILDLANQMGASHATLPHTAKWPQKPWPPEVFGWLLKIYYKADGTVDSLSTQAVNQQLMSDDTSDPPGKRKKSAKAASTAKTGGKKASGKKPGKKAAGKKSKKNGAKKGGSKTGRKKKALKQAKKKG